MRNHQCLMLADDFNIIHNSTAIILNSPLGASSLCRTHHLSFAFGAMNQMLYVQMAESGKLDEVILKNLEGLGHGE